MEGLGRMGIGDDLDLSRTVGWFTTLYPVWLELQDGVDPVSALGLLKEQLRLVPNRGIAYGALRYLSEEEVSQRFRALPPAEVNFLYQGYIAHAQASPSFFRSVDGPPGPLHSPRTPMLYRLSLNAWVAGDGLHVDWTYSDRVYKRRTVERLAQDFIARLRRLIGACTPSELSSWPSEAREFDWTADDVQNIVAAIGKTIRNP